jgi:RhtB (resistance to homoserine/threonine) family protein
MLDLFFTIGILMTLAVILPGPDMVLVTKNTILHSRRAGLLTSIGIGSANTIHITYCMLGLAVVISKSILIFDTIKYIGAAYLIYLGCSALLSKHKAYTSAHSNIILQRSILSDFEAFKQGFICNLLNPKATLFFLALYTAIIKQDTPILWEIAFAIEMLVIIFSWFCMLTILLSHSRVIAILNHMNNYIEKVLGIFLILFGIFLSILKN